MTNFKRKGATVAKLVEVATLGHAWSGGAAKHAYSDEKGPDASRMAWRFAQRQFRERTSDRGMLPRSVWAPKKVA